MGESERAKEGKLEVLARVEKGVNYTGRVFEVNGSPIGIIQGFNRHHTPLDDVKGSRVGSYFKKKGYNIEEVRLDEEDGAYEVLCRKVEKGASA